MLPLMAEWSLSKQIFPDVCCDVLQINLKRRQAIQYLSPSIWLQGGCLAGYLSFWCWLFWH